MRKYADTTHNPALPHFRNPALPQSRTSAIPHFRNPAIPHFRNSAIPHFRNPAIPHFRNSAMRLTFTLSDAQFSANDRAGVMVGLPLTVQLDAGPLVMGQDDTAGWFVRASYGPAALIPVSLERVAFCGRVAQIEQWRGQEDVLCQALLDCGVPMRFDLLDPDRQSGQTGSPFALRTGDWLVGVASLRGLLAFDTGDLLWAPVQGTIVDIQRLVLDGASSTFGALRWLHGLPRHSYAPDQVFVTVEVR